MSISMLPPDTSVGLQPPSKATWKTIMIFVLVVVASIAVSSMTGDSKREASAELKNRQAEQQLVRDEGQSLRRQIGELESSGGSGRLQLASQLVSARQNWTSLISDIVEATGGTITLDGFSTHAPRPESNSPLTLSGRTPNRKNLNAFITKLRKASTLADVQLQRANVSEYEVDGATSRRIEFTLIITLKPLASLPGGDPKASGGTR